MQHFILMTFVFTGWVLAEETTFTTNQMTVTDFSTDILGRWEYVASVSESRPNDRVWTYLVFTSNGTVECFYDFSGQTNNHTDLYTITFNGPTNKYQRSYPIIKFKSPKPHSTRFSEWIGVTIDYDCRFPISQGKVLKFTDPDGLKAVFRRPVSGRDNKASPNKLLEGIGTNTPNLQR